MTISGTSNPAILVINTGSSSVKFAVFDAVDADSDPRRLFSGALERVGLPHARLHVEDTPGNTLCDEEVALPDHREALRQLIRTSKERLDGKSLVAVGHRVAHGGPDCDCPLPITRELEVRMRGLVPLAPLHQPHNLDGISAVREMAPHLLQIACFDTAFHHGLPRIAQLMSLPREFQTRELRRYGFHGLSSESVVEVLRNRGVAIENERIIVAHLGNGASMCAIKHGQSVETTMGFSTLAGLMMGTRTGDLDPGAVLYLMTEKGMSAEAVQHLLYERSGLLGVSGVSSDMRELLGLHDNRAAREAIQFFCYRARSYLVGLTAVLGGLDRLVFTGGIGANAPEIRGRICDGLGYLGIEIEDRANGAGDSLISTPEAAVTVQALASDEEVMIARHVLRLAAVPAHIREASHL
ncbi:MAG: acetate/propionate family kinase [Thermomicrobiales bacterium]